jgi:DNA polymerase IIIc chi subunit
VGPDDIESGKADAMLAELLEKLAGAGWKLFFRCVDETLRLMGIK